MTAFKMIMLGRNQTRLRSTDLLYDVSCTACQCLLRHRQQWIGDLEILNKNKLLK